MFRVFVRIILPIIGIVYFIVVAVQGLTIEEWGLGVLMILAFLLNLLLERQYHTQFVGDIEIQEEDDRTTFSLVLEKYPEDWADKPQVIFKIKQKP